MLLKANFGTQQILNIYMETSDLAGYKHDGNSKTWFRSFGSYNKLYLTRVSLMN
jgi:hypothetical protein